MKRIELVLERSTYSPGEILRGHITIETDSSFKCNKVSVILRGEIVNKTRYTDEGYIQFHEKRRKYIEIEKIILERAIISSGTTEYEFQINIPDNALPSCRVLLGGVEYKVEGKLCIPRALDLKSSIEITIIPNYRILIPRPQSRTLRLRNSSQLIVELESDILSPDRPFTIRTKLLGKTKIRGARYEIIHYQRSKIRWSSDNNDLIVGGQSVSSKQLLSGRWLKFPIFVKDIDFIEVSTKTLRLSFGLKVTVDIPFRLDKILRIPLRIGHVPKPQYGANTEQEHTRLKA